MAHFWNSSTLGVETNCLVPVLFQKKGSLINDALSTEGFAEDLQNSVAGSCVKILLCCGWRWNVITSSWLCLEYVCWKKVT